ncbi:MAG: glycosyltransferase [bacterium]
MNIRILEQVNCDRTVTIAIGTHNRKELLGKCLEALAAQTYPAELMEVVVVDNESTDGTEEMVRSFNSPFKIRCAGQPNRAEDSSNVGARLAEHDFLIFIDDDVIPHPGMVEAHIKTHARYDEPVAVIGRLDWPEEQDKTPFDDYACRSGALMAHHRIKDPDNVHFKYALHGNISFPRDVFLKSGGYTDEYYMADTIFAHRISREHGVRLVHNPDASADHCCCASFPLYLERRELCGNAAVVYYFRNPELARYLKITWARAGGPLAWLFRTSLSTAYKVLHPLIPPLERLYPLSRPLLFFGYRVCSLYRYLKGVREQLARVETQGLEKFVDPLV